MVQVSRFVVWIRPICDCMPAMTETKALLSSFPLFLYYVGRIFFPCIRCVLLMPAPYDMLLLREPSAGRICYKIM